MTAVQLTESEKRYLEDLRKLPVSMRSRLLPWALELLPSIGLFVFGLIQSSQVFVILGFLSLLYFSMWRIYGQFRSFKLMHSIYRKQLLAAEGKNA
jgi:hypothetical protein